MNSALWLTVRDTSPKTDGVLATVARTCTPLLAEVSAPAMYSTDARPLLSVGQLAADRLPPLGSARRLKFTVTLLTGLPLASVTVATSVARLSVEPVAFGGMAVGVTCKTSDAGVS